MTSTLLYTSVLCALSTRLLCHHCDESHPAGDVARFAFDCSARNIARLPINISSRATQLNLADNDITVVPENAFIHLPNLVRLDLSNNEIIILQKHCFVGLVNLRELIMPENKLDLIRLPRETFAGLPSLQILAIAFQGKGGQYPVTILEPLIELRTLSVTRQNVSLPEVYGRLPKLTTLVLDGASMSCDLSTVTVNTFAVLRNSKVSTLMLRHAFVKRIELGAFSNFKNLRVLNLCCNEYLDFKQVVMTLGKSENNSIDTVILDNRKVECNSEVNIYDLNYFCDGGQFWQKVKRLSLRSIGLTTFIPRDANCLCGLQEIYVDYNPLTFSVAFQPKLTRYFKNLKKVVMTYSNVPGPGYKYKYCRTSGRTQFHTENYITQYPHQFPDVNVTAFHANAVTSTPPVHFYIPSSINIVDVSDSNFRSTLTNSGMLSFSRENNVLFLNVSGTRSIARRGGILVGLTQLQILDASHGIVESIHPEFLKQLPSLRVLNQSHNKIGAADNDFFAIFSFARLLEDVDLSTNGLRYINHNAFDKLTKLKVIKLGNNAFRHFDIQMKGLTSLELLDITENRLPFLTSSFMQELDMLNATFALDMRRNPLICNCDSVPFIRWLQTTAVNIVDKTEMTCLFHKSNTRLEHIDLGNLESECSDTFVSRKWWHVLVGCVSVVVVMCLIFGILCVIYRRPCHKVKRSQMRYDAAVLYDEEDVDVRRWVQNKLVEKVEKQWQMKLFIMGRDCEAGVGEIAALEKGIEQSDKVILCLSQNVLKSNKIRDQLQSDLADIRSEHKYIFLKFETSREQQTTNVPKECEHVLETLIFKSPAIRLNWDPRTEDIFWLDFRRNFGSTSWRSCVVSGRSVKPTALPGYSYTELLQRESNNKLDG